MSVADELQRTLDFATFQGKNLGDPTAADDVTKTDNATAPADPAAVAAPGASFKAAPANHVHQGVHAVNADANPNLFGNVQLVSGTGITLSQAGNAITVATNAAAVNKITWADDDQLLQQGNVEEIVAEWNINFDDAGAGTIQARLTALVNVSAGTGTFRLYTGATAPRATAGGTVRATITTTNTAFEQQTNLGAAFANPGGQRLVQITSQGSAAPNRQRIRGYEVAIG
jgi:hypothetical protein